MSDQNDDLRAERARLQAEVNRLQVSRDSGVPVAMLSDAVTVEEAQARVDALLAWKAETGSPAPVAPSSAPQYLPNQLNRETLPYLTPGQVTAAHRAGQLEGIGAPAPQQRKTGERNGRRI